MGDGMADSAYTHEAGFAYTVATGKLFCPMEEFHRRAEALLGRPILTHEFGQGTLWDEMREAFEAEAIQWVRSLDDPGGGS